MCQLFLVIYNQTLLTDNYRFKHIRGVRLAVNLSFFYAKLAAHPSYDGISMLIYAVPLRASTTRYQAWPKNPTASRRSLHLGLLSARHLTQLALLLVCEVVVPFPKVRYIVSCGSNEEFGKVLLRFIVTVTHVTGI